jgi:hypothetical protein
MNRTLILTFALTVALFSHADLCAQSDSTTETPQSDSFMLRFKNAKHIGLSTDETLSGYVLHLYTPAQREQNLASLAAYREDLVAFNARIESIYEKRRNAQQERVPVDKLNAITQERNRLESERPNSSFAQRIYLYDIVRLGVDYVEIRGAEKPGDSVLIPLSKICKVIVKSTGDDSKTGEPSDEPKSR